MNFCEMTQKILRNETFLNELLRNDTHSINENIKFM